MLSQSLTPKELRDGPKSRPKHGGETGAPARSEELLHRVSVQDLAGGEAVSTVQPRSKRRFFFDCFWHVLGSLSEMRVDQNMSKPNSQEAW